METSDQIRCICLYALMFVYVQAEQMGEKHVDERKCQFGGNNQEPDLVKYKF